MRRTVKRIETLARLADEVAAAGGSVPAWVVEARRRAEDREAEEAAEAERVQRAVARMEQEKLDAEDRKRRRVSLVPIYHY